MAHDHLQQLASDYPYVLEFLDQIMDALYICDINGRLIYINKAAEVLDGYSKEEIYSLHVKEAYGLDELHSPLLRALTTSKPVVNFAFRYFINGREVYQICNASPIYHKGTLIGAYTLQRDVTLMKEIIEKNFLLQTRLFSVAHEHDENNSPSMAYFDQLLGEHPLFVECKHLASLAANGDSNVFLIGETGSGKELFARCIHAASQRRNEPFLAINCAAIPETLIESILFGTSKGIYTGAVQRSGLFEQANGGTVFLDEINSMPLESQAKLLRVLEDKTVQHLGSSNKIQVNFRIISSSNAPPQEAIQNHQIREDLFYRLAVINIMIPNLAQRSSDIFLLTKHFISHYNEQFCKQVVELDEEVRAFFLKFHWPGNVRQLKHCIESAMNFVGTEETTIKVKHLPHYLVRNTDNLSPSPFEREQQHASVKYRLNQAENGNQQETVFQSIQNNEKQRIIEFLIRHNGNVTQAAEALGMTRQTLVYRIKKYQIK